jgi:hypothetical protein
MIDRERSSICSFIQKENQNEVQRSGPNNTILPRITTISNVSGKVFRPPSTLSKDPVMKETKLDNKIMPTHVSGKNMKNQETSQFRYMPPKHSSGRTGRIYEKLCERSMS